LVAVPSRSTSAGSGSFFCSFTDFSLPENINEKTMIERKKR
jgi:hypothetical protein